MNKHTTKHATFVIERLYENTPEQVFAAWADASAKAQWFVKSDEFDFRVGGRESNHGGPPGGPTYTFDAYYQEIIAGKRIVYTYSLDLDKTRISVSVVTVEIELADSRTRLTYTEQGVYLDGHDTPDQREHGTRLMLDKLGDVIRTEPTKGASNETVHTRIINAPCEIVFSAWAKPELLAQWWGPKGFTNTFQEFDFRPGGNWVFIMHGPNGTDFPNKCTFDEISSPNRIVLRHFSPDFQITAEFVDVSGKTKITFCQSFETEEALEKLKHIVVQANEENLDRLEEVVKTLG